MPTLRWGILATGRIATKYVTDLRIAGLTVSAVGSRSMESAQAFAGSFEIPRAHGSYEALVADPEVDIVYIATPHPMHHEAARLVLNNGKHVLIEKPLTLNRGEAEDLRRLGAEKGLLVMEAMWTRYLPHMMRIHEIIAAGALGSIRSVTADLTKSSTTDPRDRLNDINLGGGTLLDLGIYPISFIWDILGAPESVQAYARFGDDGVDTDVATVMHHAGGTLSTSLSSARSAGSCRAAILGTEARIELGHLWHTSGTFQLVTPDGTVLEDVAPQYEGRGMQFQAFAAEDYVSRGLLNSERLPMAESVAIMGTLDDIRRQIGLRYPGED